MLAMWQGGDRSCSVLVADADAPLREGVRLLLEAAGHRVMQARSADEAVALAATNRLDACLLDLALPGGGLNAAERIAATGPRPAVVVFTGSDDDASVQAALRAGVSGYLVKGRDDGALLDAIEIAARGFAAMPPRYLRLLVGRGRDYALGDAVVHLTRREHEVVRYLQRGADTSEIARLLGLSPITVRRHISAALRKLGASSRPEAVALLEHPVRS